MHAIITRLILFKGSSNFYACRNSLIYRYGREQEITARFDLSEISGRNGESPEAHGIFRFTFTSLSRLRGGVVSAVV